MDACRASYLIGYPGSHRFHVSCQPLLPHYPPAACYPAMKHIFHRSKLRVALRLLPGLFVSLAFGPAHLNAQSLRSDATNAVWFYNTDVVDEVYLDHQAASDGTAVSASGTHSFTGQDGNGNTRTMVFTGQTTASATYGGLHSAASGTITNTYYNASNPAYIDPDTGNVNPNGSPEALDSSGYASFSETLQYGGALQAGYTAHFIFHLDGTNGGGNLLAFLGAELQATVAGNPTEYFVANQSGNVSMDFATKSYAINGNTPQSLMVVLDTDFQADLRHIPDGSNVSGFANFSDTLTLAGVEIVDANGNPVSGVTVTTDSGVPVNVVPEPATWTLVAGATLLLFIIVRRRPNGGTVLRGPHPRIN